ncbi:MAG: hypothetical protein RJB39_714 [Candidatus Parcubacteria bacterium]|jgi:MFS family permease
MKKFLTRNIVVVSIVSFFTDIASEMLYPILPLYIRKIGFGPLMVGVIEACSEAVSGFNKIFFGHLSDTFKKRKIFIQIGYGVSAVAKPLIGLFPTGWFIFGARVIDRAGKGIRTSPRDALITSETTPEYRSRAFGFHRSIDTLGAVIGPVVAFLLLLKYPGEYALICLLALIPGIIAFAFTFMIREESAALVGAADVKPRRYKLNMFKEFFKSSSTSYRKLLYGFFFLALLNSSNMFLVLRAKEAGISDMYILFGYIVYNLIFALSAYPIGVALDRYGHKRFYILAICIFALTYGLFGTTFTSAVVCIGLFAMYGIFSAIEETASKSWISLYIPDDARGTGFGLQALVNTVGFLIGSALTGLVWQLTGGTTIFATVSLLALPVALYFIYLQLPTPAKQF